MRSGSSSGEHLDAQPSREPRPHALLEQLEIARRPIRGDDDLAARIDQRVERVAELGLDHLALQKLRVVENKQVDRPQRLLERHRRLRLQRGDEAVHELLRGQINSRAPLLDRGLRDRLEEMGLAEAGRGVDVERAEGGQSADADLDDALGGVERELVGAPDEEMREVEPTVERGAGEGFEQAAAVRLERRPARGRLGRRRRPGRGGARFVLRPPLKFEARAPPGARPSAPPSAPRSAARSRRRSRH